MRHDLFEKCLTHRNFTREFVKEQAPRIVRDHAEQLIGCGIYDESNSIKEVMRIQPQLQRFANTYTIPRMGHQQHNLNNGTLLEGHGMSPSVNFVATTVQNTEEGTVSTELGLKGFIDATVKATTRGCAVQRTIYGNEQPTPSQNALMAIELKTGHNQTPHMNHVAQLSLYTLTLRSRHGSMNSVNQNGCISAKASKCNGASNGGMLLYLNHESLNAVHVSPAMNEIKSLLSQRNTIATEMKLASKPRGITIQYETENNDGQKMNSRKKKR